MKSIFDTSIINGLKLKNRVIRSATREGLSKLDGSLPDEQINIYEELAKGGVGTIITGLASVSTFDIDLEGMMRLSDDKIIPSYQKLTEKVKAYDCVFLAQLALSSYEKIENKNKTILEADNMLIDDIHYVVNLFAQAARRAQEAGFDGVQIHAAHGFFLSKFISPAYNHRNDKYGGTPKNRVRILIDIIKAIRAVTHNFHLSIKINCSDFIPNGLTFKDSLIACKELSLGGIDSIEVSGNGALKTQIKPMENEAYFLDFATELKKYVNIPVILVGGHRSIEHMNMIINDNCIDYLSMSRPLIKEPDLVERWRQGDYRPSTCISCNDCYKTHARQCIFNKRNN